MLITVKQARVLISVKRARLLISVKCDLASENRPYDI